MDEDSGAVMKAYQKAVNKIDDYFEYRNHSKLDSLEVAKILAELTREVRRIGNEK